jgi:hypothetical protein
MTSPRTFARAPHALARKRQQVRWHAVAAVGRLRLRHPPTSWTASTRGRSRAIPMRARDIRTPRCWPRRSTRWKGATGGLIVVGSGMAAVTAAMMGLLKAGDHVIGGDQLYGRSLRLMNAGPARVSGSRPRWPIRPMWRAIAAAIRPETKMILIEVVSNPTLRVADMDGIAALCRKQRHPSGGGQHLFHPARLSPAGAWRRYRHPFGDEAAGRAFRRDAGLCGRARSGAPARRSTILR